MDLRTPGDETLQKLKTTLVDLDPWTDHLPFLVVQQGLL